MGPMGRARVSALRGEERGIGCRSGLVQMMGWPIGEKR